MLEPRDYAKLAKIYSAVSTGSHVFQHIPFTFFEKTLENHRWSCNGDIFFPLKVRMTSVAFPQLSYTDEDKVRMTSVAQLELQALEFPARIQALLASRRTRQAGANLLVSQLSPLELAQVRMLQKLTLISQGEKWCQGPLFCSRVVPALWRCS